MDQIELKKRLSSLKRDPMYQNIVDKTIATGFYNKKEICWYISDIILMIMENVYKPIGLWNQNPKSQNKDLGVVFDESIWSLLHYREDKGGWGLINYANTNYSGWIIILNTTHRMFIDYCKKMNVSKVTIEGVEFDINEDFSFNSNWNENIELTKIRLRRILVLTYFFRENIFNPNCEIYFELINLFRKTSGKGKDAEDFFETNIIDFFPDLISYKKTKGDGDYLDRTQGVDFRVLGKLLGDEDLNVKSIKEIDDTNKDKYIMSVAISETSKCDYIVFVLSDFSRILKFKNDKTKIIRNNDGTVEFSSELLIKQLFYATKFK